MYGYGARRASSLLELEAAEFFKLDLSQIQFSANRSALDLGRHISPSTTSLSSGDSAEKCAPTYRPAGSAEMRARRNRPRIICSSESARKPCAVCGQPERRERPRLIKRTDQRVSQQELSAHTMQPARVRQQQNVAPTKQTQAANSPRANQGQPPPAATREPLHTNHPAALSSASSTNSLPSISSSPSVSPSLVCPHLSLDDLLAFRQGSGGSPHTVGLCPRCRLDPPPNIHSPLSPHFKPHHVTRAQPDSARHGRCAAPTMRPAPVMRGNSDHQASSQQARKRRLAHGAPFGARQKSDLTRGRDDSLDHCLAPAELRRMQMSPSLRNSVEFIRRNSMEPGRVIRIYKNGEPFEKPLRVCILRDEFSSLNHLLDHINSRLLVPKGARFLFHLDGQPVYSVHELKHASVYVVSGTRQYDYRTSEVLRERQQREQQTQVSRAASQEQHLRSPAARLRPERPPGKATPGQSQGAWGSTSHELSGGRDMQTYGGPSESRSETHRARVTPRQTAQLPGAPASAATQALSCQQAPAARRDSGPGESRARGPENKFSRCDESTSVSSGELNASNQLVSAASDAGPVRLTRAKSELSALPAKKAKKSVTFVDTQRGLSPARSSDLPRSYDRRSSDEASQVDRVQAGLEEEIGAEPPASVLAKSRDSSTSEIGIQVSDSIDGFLIDLPVALPAKGDDSNLSRPRDVARAPQASRASNGRATAGKATTTSGRPRQIVTITERQLSLEEMHKLQDLSAGDHHHDTPPLDQKPSGSVRAAIENQAPARAVEPEVVPDFSDTIAIGADPQPKSRGDRGVRRLITTGARREEAKQVGVADAATASRWQYPGGRASSATPTERPVSQSGPSETVRARVTTPTPSLSTCGDNTSLAMSYELVSQGADGQQAAVAHTGTAMQAERLRSTPSKLPAKERVEVKGTLCHGLHEPTRNFRLVWVNGFAINDLYPENTRGTAQELAGGEPSKPGGRASSSSSPSARLTPGYNPAADQAPGRGAGHSGGTAYKPSERYHNWICHSRKHDELVYPAGTLVVLWCRWTNEQRYYSAHTSNVSALALATLDLDLAASAQVCDLNERPAVASNIHLWSLTRLNTLLIVQDDHFRLKLIFSLRLRNTKTAGCELSIAARDEKQLLLFEYNRKLPTSDGAAGLVAQADRRTVASDQEAAGVMMRSSKPLQSNQLPLFLLRVPNLSEGQQQALASGELTLSFGRRHFELWSSDRKQKKLRLMQSDKKSAKLVELIGRANCLCRLSPGEFLLGDSEGNVALLLVNCHANQSGPKLAPGASPKKKRSPAARIPLSGPDENSKYTLEAIDLLGPALARSTQGTSGAGNSNSAPAQPPAHAQLAITCITRVTGSLFMSADSSCTIRFWKIKRAFRAERKNSVPTVRLASLDPAAPAAAQTISCEQLSSISLPPDLGFVCALITAQYNLKDSLVEFYVVSTSNTILLGSVKLPGQLAKPGRGSSAPGGAGAEHERQAAPMDLLANSSLSVVYEGHETSASNLVADYPLEQEETPEGPLSECQYFTCSLDCRICKWQGKRLLWKSLLPSSCASLAVHPTGFVLAVGSLDGTVYVLDKTSGLLISYFPLTPVRINCLAYSSDGSLLAAACANGSIFMLPVYERGLKYKKVSIFQSPHPVVSLQFSMDNRCMLTSVSHGPYQELILWDLPNFRYMRDNVKLAADKIRWFDSICSGSEDVRATWENANLVSAGQQEVEPKQSGHKRAQPMAVPAAMRRADATAKRDQFVVNLSCHRLIKSKLEDNDRGEPSEENFVVASDTRGYLRLFRYPCYDIQQGFLAVRISSTAVNCCRFLHSGRESNDYFVSTSLDGSICLWTLE